MDSRKKQSESSEAGCIDLACSPHKARVQRPDVEGLAMTFRLKSVK